MRGKKALDYDKFSIGVFKPKEEENKINPSGACRSFPYQNKCTVLLFETWQR